MTTENKSNKVSNHYIQTITSHSFEIDGQAKHKIEITVDASMSHIIKPHHRD